MRPIEFGDFLASQEMRDESWRRRFAMEEQFGGAKPGRGHRALASSTRPARSRASSPRISTICIRLRALRADDVVELHGNTTYATCLDCGKRYELPWVKQSLAQRGGRSPECTVCDGYIKTATVSFGQAMPEAAMRRAQELTESCDLFLAIGSSLVVWPAAGFPLAAKRNGARLVIINRDETEFDEIADLVLHDDIGSGARAVHRALIR